MKWHVHAIFEPHDLWIGVSWERDLGTRRMRIYVCLLPCLPIIFTREEYNLSAESPHGTGRP